MNIHRIFYLIKEPFREIRHRWQRATRGYSDRDCYGIHDWFEKIMPRMLEDFKQKSQGCIPGRFCYKDKKENPNAQEEWNAILDRIIFCFTEMNKETCSMKNEYWEEYIDSFDEIDIPNFNEKGEIISYEINYIREPSPELKKLYRSRETEIDKYREEMKNEGFELFSRYFWSLWH